MGLLGLVPQHAVALRAAEDLATLKCAVYTSAQQQEGQALEQLAAMVLILRQVATASCCQWLQVELLG
jgi:hypothetical protein